MDFSNCPCSGKTLGRLLQPAVMGLLAHEPLHGYVIVQQLAQMSLLKGHSPDPAGIYRLLKSMEDDGYVSSTWQLTDTGPAKRRFALTSAGRSCLNQWIDTLQEYQSAIADLLQTIRPRQGKPRKSPPSKCSSKTCCGGR